MRNVLILGGTGFVGRALCGRLAEHVALRSVVATRRMVRGRAVQFLPNVDPIEADVFDDAALQRLVRESDAVVNLVAQLHGSEAEFERTHVELPRRLVRAGARRIVHVSALGAAADAPSKYLRSKAAGEAALKGSTVALTLLRPSVIFGAEDRFLNLFARLQSFAPVMPLGSGDARFQPVWVGDVATAILRCLERPATIGQTFELAGPTQYTLSQLVQLAGRWSGHERRQIALPGFAARLQALLLELAPGDPLMSRDNLDSMRVPNVASGRLPGLAELGIAPTPLDAVAPLYLAHGRTQLDDWRAARSRG